MGRCKTFDASADGYGRGEGFAALVLTQHSGGDGGASAGLLAIVQGSAVNTAGRSSGLTAPNGPAQHTLLSSALAAGRAGAADVVYLAVHGTGTPLGDPIGEPGNAKLHALSLPYRRCPFPNNTHTGTHAHASMNTHQLHPFFSLPPGAEVGAVGGALAAAQQPRALAIGSIKSCYGHTEGAAGVWEMEVGVKVGAKVGGGCMVCVCVCVCVAGGALQACADLPTCLRLWQALPNHWHPSKPRWAQALLAYLQAWLGCCWLRGPKHTGRSHPSSACGS